MSELLLDAAGRRRSPATLRLCSRYASIRSLVNTSRASRNSWSASRTSSTRSSDVGTCVPGRSVNFKSTSPTWRSRRYFDV